MHTALRLGSGHTLHTMNTRLILQSAIDIGTADSKVDFLVATYGTLRYAGDRKIPAFRVAVALVHLEQIACKQTGFVAACTRTDLHLHVLGILWILRNKGNLDFFFQLWL